MRLSLIPPSALHAGKTSLLLMRFFDVVGSCVRAMSLVFAEPS